MAKLEPNFPLSDSDASTIIGLHSYEDVVVMTTSGRVFVIDTSSRRITRSFSLPNDGDSFTSATVVKKTCDGADIMFCCVGEHLWSWSMVADDLESAVEKTPLPFPGVDLAPIEDGVAVISADGRAAVVERSERRVTQIGTDDCTPIAARTRIVDGRWATVSFSDVGGAQFRLFDFVTKSDHSFSFSSLRRTEKSVEAFLRRNSVCVIADGKILEVAFESSRGNDMYALGRAKGDVRISEESRVLWIDPVKDYFFCVTSGSLELRSLKFGTIFSVQPFSSALRSLACCRLTGALCVVSDDRLVCYPYEFPVSSAKLSANFGKKLSGDAEGTAEATAGWQKRRQGIWNYDENDGAEPDKKSRGDLSEFSPQLSASLTSASQASAFLKQLRNDDGMSKANLSMIFETLVEMLLSKNKAEASTQIVWPKELFQFLMSASVVRRWDSVVDLLILRSDLPAIDLALRQPGLDAANLCRLLRFVAFLSCDDSAATDLRSKTKDKRRLLLQIVSLSVRDEDAKKVLKKIPVAETVGIIENLLTLLKDEANSFEKVDEEGEGEDEERNARLTGEIVVNDSPRPNPLTLPHASLLRWITLLVDSHFLDFIMGDEEKYFRLLVELETFTHDLEGYFQTREALDGLLGDMKERMALYGGSGALKTSMGPDDDYCIQVIHL